MPPTDASGPASLGSALERSTLLPLTTLSSTVSAPALSIPPAITNEPFGAFTAAWLPETTLCNSVSVPSPSLKMPPAPAPEATDETIGVEPARLSVMRVFVTVNVPALSIAPPNANAHGIGPQKSPGGAVVCGVTLFPVMTLSAIVTVAPVVNPVAHGIDTPPPKLTTVSGTELLRPPVIVTPRTDTALTGPSW